MLIGFTGVPGSGKSYSADQMLNEYIAQGSSYNEVYNCNFGAKIKEITLSLFPEWNYRHTRGDLKEVVDEDFDISPRRVQQIIGKSLLEINPNLWSDIIFRNLDRQEINYDSRYILVTIDDVRFENDFEAIKSRNGIMVGLIPGDGYKELDEEIMNYETEKHIDGIVGKCDYTFINNFDEVHKRSIRELARDLRRD